MRRFWAGIAVALGLLAGAAAAQADWMSPPYFQKDEQDEDKDEP